MNGILGSCYSHPDYDKEKEPRGDNSGTPFADELVSTIEISFPSMFDTVGPHLSGLQDEHKQRVLDALGEYDHQSKLSAYAIAKQIRLVQTCHARVSDHIVSIIRDESRTQPPPDPQPQPASHSQPDNQHGPVASQTRNTAIDVTTKGTNTAKSHSRCQIDGHHHHPDADVEHSSDIDIPTQGIIQPTAPAVEPALPDFGVPNTLLALMAYVQDETAEHNTQGDSSHDDDDNLSLSLPPDELLTDSQPATKIDQICIMEGAYHDSTEVNKEADDGARQHASPVKRCVKRAASAKATDIAASFKVGSMTEGIFIDAFASLLFKDEMRDNPETFGKKIFIPTSVMGLLNIENVTRVGSKDNFSPRALAEHLSECLKGVNLSKAEQLLLPVINNDHWTLYIVYLNQGSFDILDSNDYDQIGGKESQHHYPLA
uniref:Ubiquitin-like protease family profile domain-containing protein n=1 Tax=Oryza barthii TaxID=65489 RepID=A0A0D3GGH7_9ORYZ